MDDFKLNDLIESTYEVIIKDKIEDYKTIISSFLYEKLHNYGYIDKDENGNDVIKLHIIRKNNLNFVINYQCDSSNLAHDNAIDAIKELEKQLNNRYRHYTKWKDCIEVHNNPISLVRYNKHYDKTKDADYRNPIYYPKRKKYGKR